MDYPWPIIADARKDKPLVNRLWEIRKGGE